MSDTPGWEPTPESSYPSTPLNCSHPRVETRRKTTRDGRVQVRDQCLDCGRSSGHAKAHRDVRLDELDEWDYALEDARAEERNRYFQRMRQEYEAAREREKNERIAFYRTYILSPEWRHKRQLVLNRAAGVCEGCNERNAAQVHHLTYAHLGDEFLWELAAVCMECHRRLHPDRGL